MATRAMTDIVLRMKALPDLTNEKAWEVVYEDAREIERLRVALRPFAGLLETSEAETAVPNDSPVTIRCHLGDIRRAFKALNHPITQSEETQGIIGAVEHGS